MIAFVLVSVLFGGIAGLLAVYLGASGLDALIAYSATGVASFLAVLLRALFCVVLGNVGGVAGRSVNGESQQCPHS